MRFLIPHFLRLAWIFCVIFAPHAHAAHWSLALQSIRHAAVEVDNLRVELDAAARGEADIALGALRVMGVEYRDLRVHCSGFYFDTETLECPQGLLTRNDARGADRPPLPFALRWDAREQSFEFYLRDAEVADLSPLIKRLRAWKPQGRIDLRLNVKADVAHLQVALRGAGFTEKTGAFFARDITLTLAADARKTDETWAWQAQIHWPQGELDYPPWLFKSGVDINAAGFLRDAEWVVDQARLDVAGVGAVTASLRWDRRLDAVHSWGLVSEPIDLAAAMKNWLQPWLRSLDLPAWQASGKILFAAEGQGGALNSFFANLQNADVTESTGYIDLRGVNANIPWQADRTTQADIGIRSGRLGDLPLGEFSLPLCLGPQEARIENLVAPMLDGQFMVEKLQVRRVDSAWQGEFSGGIDGISMPQLTRALGLPSMGGRLTLQIPQIEINRELLMLKGAVGIEVFDGGLIVHDLRVVKPFDPARRLLMNVTARNLDLGLLTRAFAFGSVEGRFDADLRDLEMAGWQPQRFDARLASSPGDYARNLSFGAFKDITALGADSAALSQRIPERDGRGFGYEKIGVSCKLNRGVCELDGIKTVDGGGALLMAGRGLPSINIIGYNRRIDWEALKARVRAMIADKSAVEVE